jgi:hypothetical protein
VHTLLDHLTAEAIAYNADRLRKLANDAHHQAEALEEYLKQRSRDLPVTPAAWQQVTYCARCAADEVVAAARWRLARNGPGP